MHAPVPYSQPRPPIAISPLIRDDVPLSAIVPADWNALVDGMPLLSHEYFSALHESGCASVETGWRPRFLTAWEGSALVGAMPLYEKSHSYGEYVFDWGWADAYRRHGRRYYPKLVAAVPFTPVPGPRLFGSIAGIRRALLARALQELRSGFSSLHVLFIDESQVADGTAAAMVTRDGVQFHWRNACYRDFDDYLAAFNHDKRKKIRQERRRLAESGVSFVRRIGDEISAQDLAFFFDCYRRTYRAHHSTPYLTLEFFERIATTLAPHLLLVLGYRHGQRLCAALDVFNGTTLWGRYWGTGHYLPGLHFEACYYQAIEFCIERGIATLRGWRAGRAQAGARAASRRDAFAACDRRSLVCRRDRRVLRARTAGRRARDWRARIGESVSQRSRRASTLVVSRRERLARHRLANPRWR